MKSLNARDAALRLLNLSSAPSPPKVIEHPVGPRVPIRQGDKSAFVRSQPMDIPASEVVTRAAEKGLGLSKAFVYNIRSNTRKAARALMANEGRKKVEGDPPELEAQLRELILILGPARAKKLISQVETSLGFLPRPEEAEEKPDQDGAFTDLKR